MALAVEVPNSASAAGVSTLNIGLNTSGTNRIALIFVTTSDNGSGIPQVSSVTSSGLTWAKYTSYDITTDGHRLELWWAYAAAQQTAATVTVNTNVTCRGLGLGVCAISGVPNTRWTAPFDTHASLPSVAQNASGVGADANVNFSTTDDQTVALALWGANITNVNTPSTPSGWTEQIALAFNGSGAVAQKMYLYSKVYSAIQTNTNVSLGSLVHWGLTVQAVGGNIVFPHQVAVCAGF